MRKKALSVLALCSAVMMLAAAAWACPGSEGANSCSSKKQTVSAKSGEALGGGGTEKSADTVTCPYTGKKVSKADCPADCSEKTADGAACPYSGKSVSKTGESLGGGGSEKKAEGAACPYSGKTSAKSGSEMGVYSISDGKAGCDSADAGCAAAKSTEAMGGGGTETAKMDKTTAYNVGDKVSDFSAVDSQSGETKTLSSLAGEKGTVLIFWNQECPYVKDVQDRVNDFAKEYAAKGINVVAIDAGVNNSDGSIKKYAADKTFPVLINKDSKLASDFGATSTPEVFFLDKDMVIKYHGAFDSNTMRGKTNPTPYVKQVANSILAGEAPGIEQTRHPGCSLKYADGVKPKKR